MDATTLTLTALAFVILVTTAARFGYRISATAITGDVRQGFQITISRMRVTRTKVLREPKDE